METYRFRLEKYTGVNSRHTCPNCGKKEFARYVDEKGIIFPQLSEGAIGKIPAGTT